MNWYRKAQDAGPDDDLDVGTIFKEVEWAGTLEAIEGLVAKEVGKRIPVTDGVMSTIRDCVSKGFIMGTWEVLHISTISTWVDNLANNIVEGRVG